jgi:hypothetical protein
LDAVTGELKEARVQKLHDGEANLRRENDAREAIGFVDGRGLGVLGVGNENAPRVKEHRTVLPPVVAGFPR